MGWMICPNCGTRFSGREIPSNNVLHILEDEVVDEMAEKAVGLSMSPGVDLEQKMINVDFHLADAAVAGYRCPECGTILIPGRSRLAGCMRSDRTPIQDLDSPVGRRQFRPSQYDQLLHQSPRQVDHWDVPSVESLQIGRAAFARVGITFP